VARLLADPEQARHCGQRGRDLVEQQRGALARLLHCIDTLR
jgi:3-deoxy-D-manno-octulosonic-acid transferase